MLLRINSRALLTLSTCFVTELYQHCDFTMTRTQAQDVERSGHSCQRRDLGIQTDMALWVPSQPSLLIFTNVLWQSKQQSILGTNTSLPHLREASHDSACRYIWDWKSECKRTPSSYGKLLINLFKLFHLKL